LAAKIRVEAEAVLTFNERIMAVDACRSNTADSLIPGFIDLQVNGGYGIDVMSATVDDLLTLSHELAREGVVAWLPTVITSPLEKIECYDAIIAEAMTAQAALAQAAERGSRQPVTAAILGMHLEGPFISPLRLGAHPPLSLTADGVSLERVLALKSLRLITIAPEIDGALEAIPRFSARGVVVSLGHSDATYDQAMAGIDAGARMFTHIFNAMRPLHHRDPGIAGAALMPSPARAAIIPDGIHLHPAMYELVRRARGNRGIVATTDRLSLSRAQYAATTFGNAAVNVSVSDGAARLADGTLAGSIITMLDGMRLMLRQPLIECNQFSFADMASFAPAEVMLLADRGRLDPQTRADFILLDHALELKAVFIGGREVE
jgi:N-acetylglucosamine-6-phosphate deacetylase